MNGNILRLDNLTCELLIHIFVECCYGETPHNFEIELGQNRYFIENILNKIKAERDRPEAVLSFTHSELTISYSVIDYILKTIDEFEFDSRIGASKEDVRNLLKKLKTWSPDKNVQIEKIEIKNSATPLLDRWIFCPECQHSWEENIKYRVTACPNCKSILLNPICDLITM